MSAARSASSARAGEPAQPASAARSVLRRWANAASTTAKTSGRGAVVTRRLPPMQRDQAGVDVGRRPEHRAPDGAGAARLGVPRDLHRRHAVDLRARRGDEPVGDLGLHHHQPVGDRREAAQQVQQHRHRDVVGQVGHDRAGLGGGSVSSRSASACTTSRLAAYDGARAVDRVAQRAGEHRVDLDGDHPAGCREQTQREGAEPRADLEDDVVRRHLGGAHDAAHRVGVDDEVLPQRLGGPQAEPRSRGRGPRPGRAGTQRGRSAPAGACRRSRAAVRAQRYRPHTGHCPAPLRL